MALLKPPGWCPAAFFIKALAPYHTGPILRDMGDEKLIDELTEDEKEILAAVITAFEDDPDPESGHTYCKGEDEYEVAMGLTMAGFLRKVSQGKHQGTSWVHFGLTSKGFMAAEEL